MLEDYGIVGDIIDIPGKAAEVPPGEWRNEVLTRVNDAVVRLGVIEGEYHWHSHPDEDEFFMTLEGELLLDIRAEASEGGEGEGGEGEPAFETVTLFSHEAYTVPRGVVHRTRALDRCCILMVERVTVTPAGEAAE